MSSVSPSLWLAGFLSVLACWCASSVCASTSGTATIRFQDAPLGGVVSVGGQRFVKTADNSWMADTSVTCVDPVLTTTGATKSFGYTGSAQEYTFFPGCRYQVELWGASGGNRSVECGVYGGKGGYVSGIINVDQPHTLYVYVGEHLDNSERGSFNGGGQGTIGGTTEYPYLNDGLTGGGATDVRTMSGSWDNSSSLRSRIMVASAGSGSLGSDTDASSCTGKLYALSGANGGGLSGYDGTGWAHGGSITSHAKGGTQVSGGEKASSFSTNVGVTDGGFGYGGITRQRYGSGGGSGWYGGGSGSATLGYVKNGAGGSSYISGHTGCVAVTSTTDSSPKSGCTTGTTDNSCSVSPYGYTFTNTVMIDGAG